MPDNRAVYMDSCCFIDMVKEDIGQALDTDRKKDVWFLKQLAQACRDGEITVFTSVLSIAECTHAEGEVSEAVRNHFNSLLTSGQYVVLVQPTPFIGMEARDLKWKHGVSVRGADAVHIASALDRKCEEFLTTDGGLKKAGSAAKLLTLGLRLVRPSETHCLPAKYLQQDWVDAQAKGG